MRSGIGMENSLTKPSYPSYLELFETGQLKKITKRLYRVMQDCTLCPRECRINRLSNEQGFCRVKKLPMVSSYGPHFGEESPLVGKGGSGTIFMTHCNLRCLFCQNFEISQLGKGEEVEIEELAGYMIHLQKIGCHNINFVTPTHVVAQIAAALELAIAKGLRIPLVYNCGGYESVETLKLIEGIFDIYMPDIKYGSSQIAQEMSTAKDYPTIAKSAIKEMHNQVGDLVINKRGIAARGLLVRHLVLPEKLASTKEVLHFLAKEISINTYLNIMDQYRPHYKAFDHPPLNRAIQPREFEDTIDVALKYGLRRIDSMTKHLARRDSLY